MSKNGPSTIRFGFSVAEAIASGVPFVRTRTSAQLNVLALLKERVDLREIVQAKRDEGWRDAKIVDWLKDNSYCGRYRLRSWFDKNKDSPARTEYSDIRDELTEHANKSFDKRLIRRARLAEFCDGCQRWKKRDRWPVKKTRKSR